LLATSKHYVQVELFKLMSTHELTQARPGGDSKLMSQLMVTQLAAMGLNEEWMR
jgi:hypothetical protein